MKIIILGAGQVGATLAEHLATEHNDITIIDTDSERLRSLQERLDVLTITGNGAYPIILRRSRAEEADMLIAVTSSDETNLVACQVASSLFQIPTKIARIRSLNYLMHEELFGKSGFPIDVLISPEQLISNYVRRMIEYPDALQVVDFSDQKLQLISVKIRSSNVPLVGPSLRSFPTYLPNIDVEIAAIFRQGNAIMPNGSTTIESGDEVLFLANKTDSRQILSNLIALSPPNQRVIIAGGGNIGTRLASTLEKDFQIKIIEKNHSRVESLATHITSGVVLHGDASDRELLLSENIENTDVFCAVTNRDETNIMAALLAKRLGAQKVMALVNRPSYLELIEGGGIDTLISPQQVTIGSLLTHVRRGHIVNVHALHRGTAEAIEMIVEGSKKTSKIIGNRTKDISLPQEADIIAVVRGNKTFMGHQNVIIEAGDRVIILLLDKRKIRQVERLFQEGLSIFFSIKTMNINYISNASRILGLLLMAFSATMLPPILIALWFKENTIFEFCAATIATLGLGITLWFPFRKRARELQDREAFLIVVLLWLALSITGAFPFTFLENLHISYIDAVFETISGLTTTGATVLSDLDEMPRSILYYRQQLQFIGGGGIIVLSIAILPLLSVVGMQLFRAEMAGPFKEDKLTPRIAQTAKTLWLIYVGLVVVCAFCYWLAGLNLFDAIGYSFSTISTGGFCTHDDNFNSFQNPILEWLCVVFMLLGAINFSLHFSALRRRSLLHYWQDPEFKTYFKFWFFTIVLISSTLFYFHVFDDINTTITKTIFQVTAFFTTTGFFSEDFSNWPTFIPILLMFICLLGGCAGSTAGGIKIIRLLVLKKQGMREIQRLIHPNGHYVIKFGYSRLSHKTLDAILGFFCIFVATFLLLLLLLLAMGLDPLTAFSSLTASISNTGLRLGAAPDNFKFFSEPVKVVISIAMLAGRLELFTLFVLLTPHYWRY